jgi:mono/diheme cytochrome c family protein
VAAAPAVAPPPAPVASQCRRAPGAASTAPPRVALQGAQPAQGRRVYLEQQCALCHGESLRGAPGGPALADAGFRQAWRGRPVSELLECLKATMPPGRAGTLPDAHYLDLLSVILEANEFARDESALYLEGKP